MTFYIREYLFLCSLYILFPFISTARDPLVISRGTLMLKWVFFNKDYTATASSFDLKSVKYIDLYYHLLFYLQSNHSSFKLDADSSFFICSVHFIDSISSVLSFFSCSKSFCSSKTEQSSNKSNTRL